MSKTIKTLALITLTAVTVKTLERVKLNHYLTQYREKGKHIAESWIQLECGNYYRTFSSKKLDIN